MKKSENTSAKAGNREDDAAYVPVLTAKSQNDCRI